MDMVGPLGAVRRRVQPAFSQYDDMLGHVLNVHDVLSIFFFFMGADSTEKTVKKKIDFFVSCLCYNME